MRLPAHLERVVARLTNARATGKIDAAFDALIDSFKEITPSGVMGDARRANADKGGKLLQVCQEGLATTLKNREMWA